MNGFKKSLSVTALLRIYKLKAVASSIKSIHLNPSQVQPLTRADSFNPLLIGGSILI